MTIHYFYGREDLSWKKFTRTQQARFSIKTFVLADACTGYVWNSVIHMEDDTRINPDPEFTYNATNIVLSLPEDLLSEVRCTYIGNWYSSVELLHELGKRSSDVIGTVWKDCKALPKDAVNAFTFLDKIKGLKDTKMGTRQVFCKDIKPQAKASNKRRIHL